MSKSKPVKRVTFYGWEGEGRTEREARQDAIAKCEAAAQGHYTPSTLSWGGYALVVYREPDGWRYFLIGPDVVQGVLGHHYGHPHETSEDNAKRGGMRYLANITFEPGTTPSLPPFLDDREDQMDYLKYAVWQNAYRYHLTYCGGSDGDHHDYANEVQHQWSNDVFAAGGHTVATALALAAARAERQNPALASVDPAADSGAARD